MWVGIAWLMLSVNCGLDSTESPKVLQALPDSHETRDHNVTTQLDDTIPVLTKRHFGDLDSIIDRRGIRILVPYSDVFYYVDGNQRKGLAFEASENFEKYINEELGFHPPKIKTVVIPVPRPNMINLLAEGYADMAMGGLYITPEDQEIIDFTEPTIKGLHEVVVAHKGSPKLNSMTDLSGKILYIRDPDNSAHHLEALQQTLTSAGAKPVVIKETDQYLDDGEILEMVNAGIYPYAVIIENVAKPWASILDSIEVYHNLPLQDNISLGWACRKSMPDFLEYVNAFVRKNHKGSLLGNILFNRYVSESNFRKAYHTKNLINLGDKAAYLRKYASKYNLDWLLLTAQGYQESNLDQQVKSPVGAIGIMQLMPSTASAPPISIDDIDDMENNIHAGAKYLRYLIDQYFNEESIDSFNQRLFAIASYNAGPTRISRLRREAKARGFDNNQWFNHVEMIVAEEVGHETVQYVSNIYKYYVSYKGLNYYLDASGKKMIFEDP